MFVAPARPSRGNQGGEGAYKSRQQEEQEILDQIRVLDTQEVDRAIITERNKDIQVIHQNVMVLNSLFKDMAELVQDQQQSIDQIENNVQSAHEKTKQGVGELEAAMDHQAASCVIS